MGLMVTVCAIWVAGTFKFAVAEPYCEVAGHLAIREQVPGPDVIVTVAPLTLPGPEVTEMTAVAFELLVATTLNMEA